MPFDSTLNLGGMDFVTISNTPGEHVRRAVSSSGVDRADFIIKQSIDEKQLRVRVLLQCVDQYLMTDGLIHKAKMNVTIDIPGVSRTIAANSAPISPHSWANFLFLRLSDALQKDITAETSALTANIEALIRGES